MVKENRYSQLTNLLNTFKSGQLTRRDFLHQASVLGLTVAAVTAVGGHAEAAQPKKGGVMRIGSLHGQTSDVLDPALLFNGAQWMTAYAVRNTLTQIDPGAVLAPCLATEWEPNHDASRWTFTLRKGVEFHNGKTLTTDDVIASINHHRAEDTNSAIKPIADQIETMKTDGPNIIVFNLQKPNVDFPYIFASANFTICQAIDSGIDANSGIGTGGYVLKEYRPGVTTTLERNPNYWRDDRAHAATVELQTINDTTARISALLSDGVDVIDDIDFKLVNQLSAREGLTVEQTSGPLHYLFSMMSNRTPFESKDVRLAMKYACDREEMIKTILHGHGTVGNDHPIGPSYFYHDTNLEQRVYDPDKAKFHLKKAGMDNINVNISAGSAAFGGAVDAALLLQQSTKGTGINVEITREPTDGYWSDVYMQKPMFSNYWGGYSTASEMLSTGYVPGAAWNESVFESERFVKVLQEANAELDTSRRREMMSELQAIVRDEAGQLIFAFPNNILARNENLAHGELSSDRPMDGRQIIERWWVN